MEYVTLVVIITLVEYLFFMLVVGKAREKYKINAPATVGDVNFECYFRVQGNTIEQLVVFIPAIYMAGYYLNAIAAAVIGCFFIIGRFLYYRAYVTDPSKRAPGMVIGFLATVLLVLLALVGVVMKLI